MSIERVTGRIESVWEATFSTVLVADAAVGDTLLYVDDVANFNGAGNDEGPGGWLIIAGNVLQYDDIDDDAQTITLHAPLMAALSASDEDNGVSVWDDLYNQVSTVQKASVRLPGRRFNGELVEAVVADTIAGLAAGDRGGPGEHCLLERDGDTWEVVRVKGRPAAALGEKHCNTDDFTLTAAGDQSFELAHTPDDGSLIVHWHPDGLGGIHLLPTEWSIAGSTLTVPDPGYFAAADKIATEYDYHDGPMPPSILITEATCSLGVTMSGGSVQSGNGVYYYTAQRDQTMELGVVEQLTDGTYRAYFSHVGYPLPASQTQVTWSLDAGAGATPGATPIGLYMRPPTGGSMSTDIVNERGKHDPGACEFYYGATWRADNTPGGPLT